MNDNYKKLQETGSDWSYNSAWGDQMVEAIKEFSGAISDKSESILDVGCGEGRGIEVLLSLGHSDVTGLDLTSAKVKAGKAKGFNIVEGDFHECKALGRTFDHVFCSHTLEHAANLSEALASNLSVVKKTALIIVPIEETEFALQMNPSHTSTVRDVAHITSELQIHNSVIEFCVDRKTRLCPVAWCWIRKKTQ